MSFGDINRVNTNLQALSSQYSLNKINSRLADNQLKLSTGLRINRAEDDAAGFSIASKLSGRIAGLEQASRNVGDAKSMLDVAESGINSIMDIMVEMKSKATQGANGTLGATERGYIKDQIESLGAEIDSIVDSTTFQGTDLLKGTTDVSATFGDNTSGVGEQVANNDPNEGIQLTFQVGEGSGDTYTASMLDMSVDNLFESLNGTDLELTNSDASTFNSFLNEIDDAINRVANNTNQIGIQQNSLSIRQENLSQAVTSNSAARSRIQDADFAKVQSESVKLQIMQQTATSALAQANTSPQAVLGFLG
ncbi:MAG: flagellin [Balneolaceae bacterium]|nr:flagellin [Balneolaceae bacterium]